MVAGDAEHDRRRVVRRVVDRRHRVVDERELHRAVPRRAARRHRVGAPGRARDDRGRGGRDLRHHRAAAAEPVAEAAGGRRRRHGADEARVHARRRAARADLQEVGAARPRRVGAARWAPPVGRVVARIGEPHPRRPAPARRARPDLRLERAARPAQADEVEATGRAQRARRAPAGGGRRGAGELAVEVELERGGAERGGRAQRGGERGRADAEGVAAGQVPAHGLQNTTRVTDGAVAAARVRARVRPAARAPSARSRAASSRPPRPRTTGRSRR